MPNLVSQLIIRMIDDVSGPSKTAGASLRGLGKSAKDLEKLSGTGLGKLGDAARKAAADINTLEKIGEFRSVKRGLQGASQAYHLAQQNARKLASEMANAGTVSATMAKAHARAVREVEKSKQAFMDQGNAVRTAGSALSAAGVSVNALAAAQARLRANVVATNAALTKQAQQAQQAEVRKQTLQTAGNAAGAYASYKTAAGVRKTAHTYREFDKESRATKAFGNFNEAEMKAIIDMAIHKSAGTRFNDIQWLEGAKEFGARGVKAPAIQGILPEAANLGQAMDVTLPESVKLMEGALFSFKRDISTMEKARAEARRSADMQVAAAKASGMNSDDIKQLYKYGAVGSSMSKIHEAALLAFGGLGKKVNIGGDEMGVAFREMASKLFTPTRKGREAMAAYGIDYSKYQTMPDKLDTGNFEKMIAQQYGVKLDAKSHGKVDQIFADKSITADATKFAVEIGKALEGQLGIKNAQDRNRVVGSAERFRQNSARDIDSTKLMMDIMESIKGGNLKLANEIFGSKQGTRIAAALGDPKLWADMVAKIKGAVDGQAEKIGVDRMAGFDGAVHRFNNSIKNLETAFGRAVDNDGKGGAVTGVVNSVAGMIQSFAELSKESHLAAGALAVAGGAATAVSSTFGLINKLFGDNGPALALTGSAVALGNSAAALNLAAARLGAAGGMPDVPGGKGKPGATAGKASFLSRILTGGALAGTATAVAGAVVGGPVAMNASREALIDSTPGANREDKIANVNGHRRANARAHRLIAGNDSLIRAGHDPDAAENRQHAARSRINGAAEAIKPKVDLSSVTKAEGDVTQAGQQMNTALSFTARPEVDLSALQAAEAALQRIKGLVAEIGGSVSRVGASVRSVYADYGVTE
jgi:hypothetical protein